MTRSQRLVHLAVCFLLPLQAKHTHSCACLLVHRRRCSLVALAFWSSSSPSLDQRASLWTALDPVGAKQYASPTTHTHTHTSNTYRLTFAPAPTPRSCPHLAPHGPSHQPHAPQPKPPVVAPLAQAVAPGLLRPAVVLAAAAAAATLATAAAAAVPLVGL